ncbi:MAG: hypothetical protein ACK4FZ_02300 [Vogesella sp.]|uniref:hypothetical protein n=1 Tax=Vogesella sp. TaxID=1904252 RepID=UPI00391BA160
MKPAYLLYIAAAVLVVLLAWVMLGSNPDDPRVCPPERRVGNFCKASLPGGVIWLREIPGARPAG